MMKDHLDLTLQEAAQQLGGDYAAGVATYDQVEIEILHMADMLLAGIVTQFPSTFRLIGERSGSAAFGRRAGHIRTEGGHR